MHGAEDTARPVSLIVLTGEVYFVFVSVLASVPVHIHMLLQCH